METLESGINTVSSHEETLPAEPHTEHDLEVVQAALVATHRGTACQVWPVRRFEAKNIGEFCAALRAEIEGSGTQTGLKVVGIAIVPVLHIEQFEIEGGTNPV